MSTLKNTFHTSIIQSISHKGIGIAVVNNKAIYISNVLPNEEVYFKIIKEYKTYAIGKLLSIYKTSPQRIIEKCSIASSCGGCQLQHMNYESQINFKKQHLEAIAPPTMIPCKEQYATRNKVQFAVSEHKGDIAIGLFKTHSHQVIDTEECPIQSSIINDIFKFIKLMIKQYAPSIYNESTQHGLLRHICIRSSDYEQAGLVVIVCTDRSLEFEDFLIKNLTQHPLVKAIHINLNPNPGDTILGSETIVLYGKETLIEKIGNNQFYFNAHTFLQSNRIQTSILYDKILELGQFKPTDQVVDMYCGIGTITQHIAPQVHTIIGIEENSESIELANKSLSLNSHTNITFIEGKVESTLSDIKENTINTLIIDPPRKGCHRSVLEFITQKKIPKVIYISCNPVSLKEDLKHLGQLYTWDSVYGVDMFPQTYHVEAIVCLTLIS